MSFMILWQGPSPWLWKLVWTFVSSSIGDCAWGHDMDCNSWIDTRKWRCPLRHAGSVTGRGGSRARSPAPGILLIIIRVPRPSQGEVGATISFLLVFVTKADYNNTVITWYRVILRCNTCRCVLQMACSVNSSSSSQHFWRYLYCSQPKIKMRR